MRSRRITRRRFLQGGAVTAGMIALAPSLTAAVTKRPTGWLTGSCESVDEPLGLQTAHPRLSWRPTESSSAIRQNAYRITVSSSPHGQADLWDSGTIASQEVAAQYGGKPLQMDTSAYWSVETSYTDGSMAESALRRWSVGPTSESDWGQSRWIGKDDILEDTEEQMAGESGPAPLPRSIPAPYLRKEFSLPSSPASAMLYVAAVGYGDIHLNGQRVDEGRERSPGFTNFDHRVEYVTYDVTRLLKPGPNAVGVILGTGWYDVHDVATWHFNTAPWRQRPRMRSMLHLRYSDGTTSKIVTDDSWQASSGPILHDGIYTGERYDARLEMPGWSAAGFNATLWKPALQVAPPRGTLVPAICPGVRITDTLVPVNITQPTPGTFIVDMGQNFSGHTQLSLTAPAGHAVTMRYSEILHADGTIDTSAIDRLMQKTSPRQPFQQDTYICKGEGLETWEQRFSYAGFRYVEVTNFPGTPTLDNFRGRFAHADLKTAGEFTSSSDIVNKIQHATRWSYLSNAQSHPTDCPQREKNGWTGDAGLAIECGLTNFDSAAFYTKWLRDIADSQRPDGGIPVIVPTGGWGDGRNWPGGICPPWDAAYPTIAWTLYQYTGDLRVLNQHAPALQRYMEYFLSYRGADGLAPALGLGDWLPWKTDAPLNFITNAYLVRDLRFLQEICSATGQPKASARYDSLAQEIAKQIHAKFYNASTHQYADGSQTAQSIALYFGLVPDGERQAVFHQLTTGVEALGHIDVGILGAKFLLRALSEGGRTDLAYHLATQTDMPGWGYWMKMGSTTLWEDWKGEYSRNHIMFGDVSAWFFEWLGGIQQAPHSVAFEKIQIRPNPAGDMTSASASYNSVRGPIRSAWTLQGRHLLLSCQIPPGPNAELVLPSNARVIKVDGRSRDLQNLTLPPGQHEIETELS